MRHILATVVIAVLLSTNVVYAQSSVDGEIVSIQDIKFRSGEVKSVVVSFRNTGRDGTHYRMINPIKYSESVRIERSESADYSKCISDQREVCEVLKVRPGETVRIHYEIRAPTVRRNSITPVIWTLLAAHSCSTRGDCKWKEVDSYEANFHLSPAIVDSTDHQPGSTPVPYPEVRPTPTRTQSVVTSVKTVPMAGEITSIVTSTFAPGETKSVTVTISNSGRIPANYLIVDPGVFSGWQVTGRKSQSGSFTCLVSTTTCEVHNVSPGHTVVIKYAVRAPSTGEATKATWKLFGVRECTGSDCHWEELDHKSQAFYSSKPVGSVDPRPSNLRPTPVQEQSGTKKNNLQGTDLTVFIETGLGSKKIYLWCIEQFSENAHRAIQCKINDQHRPEDAGTALELSEWRVNVTNGGNDQISEYIVDIVLSKDSIVPIEYAPNIGVEVVEDGLIEPGRLAILPPLGPGASAVWVGIGPFPDGILFRDYNICAVVDPGQLIPEFDEANNIHCIQMNISPFPTDTAGFSGKVFVNGAEPPLGTTIAGYINGEMISTATVAESSYSLVIEQPDGLNFKGRSVEFQLYLEAPNSDALNGVLLQQTAVWDAGVITTLDFNLEKKRGFFINPELGVPGSPELTWNTIDGNLLSVIGIILTLVTAAIPLFKSD